MTLSARRQLNVAGFLACVAMMAYALYAEHVLLMAPCPLCVFQRLAVISLGFIFLAAALHDPVGAGRRVYAVLILIAAGAGAGVAGRHVWLQNLPADEVPSCGPGFDYIIDSFPLADALKLIFTGSGECASVDWQLLGLSMPAWVLIALILIGAFGVWNNLRR
jgi:disulfide bond formation protein DsbB